MKKVLVAALFLALGQTAMPCTKEPLRGIDIVTQKPIEIDPTKQERPTVVIFLSPKCPCSKSHEPLLAELSKEFKDYPFVAIHSNTDEDPVMAGKHFKEANLPFPVLRDSHAQIADRLGAFKTPHAFIVGTDGKCLFTGGVDDTKDAAKATKHYLKLALTDLKEGREVREKDVRTLGCVIQR